MQRAYVFRDYLVFVRWLIHLDGGSSTICCTVLLTATFEHNIIMHGPWLCMSPSVQIWDAACTRWTAPSSTPVMLRGCLGTLLRVLAFHRGQLPHCEADATFHAWHGKPSVHESWLCLQCAPTDEGHAGTRYPWFMPLQLGWVFIVWNRTRKLRQWFMLPTAMDYAIHGEHLGLEPGGGHVAHL